MSAATDRIAGAKDGNGDAAALGAAAWLFLAATPTSRSHGATDRRFRRPAGHALLDRA
jgi:hypothetical protein